ncbi:sialate O-acetylesterase [Desulforhopalus singaporensis]|nr:sialate O-acetylesterase [Desulforhopalus singaporensis]
MALNLLYVSANGTSQGLGTAAQPLDFTSAVRQGGENSVIVLLNDAGTIYTEGVALHKNQYVLGEGATAHVFHEDGVTVEMFTAPGSGGAQLHGTSSYNGVIGTHPETAATAVSGVQASGGVNDAGIVAESRYHFLLSGQSNMAGWANVSDFDEQLQGTQENVHMWTGNKFASLEPTQNSAPLDFGAAPNRLWAGSELSLGVNLTKALASDVYFTKVTSGGTSIDRWLYQDMADRLLEHSLKASEDIATQGYAPIMGGLAWNQGEYDVNNSAPYDQKLLALLQELQSETGISDLRLVASGVSPQMGGAVIEQEILQAMQSSEFIAYFSMLDFTDYSNGNVHFSAEGYSYMGYQFAVHLLEDLIGNPVTQDAIDGYLPLRMIPVAPVAENDSQNIVVGFDVGRQGNVLANDSDFNITETLSVATVNGLHSNIGEWIDLEEGGRIKIEADGTYDFDPGESYGDLKAGQFFSIVVPYEVMDDKGLVDQATLTLSVYGSYGREGGLYIEAVSGSTYGTSGDDVIIGTDGNDQISGNGGYDMIFDYGGNNTIRLNNSQPDSKSMVFTGKGNDSIYATAGDDVIDAGNGNNNVYSYAGDDTIIAGDGNDFINARGSYWAVGDRAGNNTIDGGDGNNRVYTGAGSDKITTGDGDDLIYSTGGGDVINAGHGNNTIDSGYNRYAGSGKVTIITAGDGNNRIYTDAGDDHITLGKGQNYVYSYGGNDNITTGNDNDFINARGNNWLVGDRAGNKTIDGGDGDNRVYTGAGSDKIITGDGDDLIYSAGGGDVINAGHGNNTIDSGYNRNAGSGKVTTITAGDGNNRIYTDAGDDHITLGDGQNVVQSFGGNDTVTTGSGDDRITLYGYNASNDAQSEKHVSSGAGNDTIFGSFGDDTIIAGQGDDVIDLRRGGNNLCIFESGDGVDRIVGFDAESDKIQFSVEGLTYEELQFLTSSDRDPAFSGSGTGIRYGDDLVTVDVRPTDINEDLFVFMPYC